MDAITALVIIAVYFLLQLVILPKLGIHTWLSRSCNVPGERKKQQAKHDAQLDATQKSKHEQK